MPISIYVRRENSDLRRLAMEMIVGAILIVTLVVYFVIVSIYHNRMLEKENERYIEELTELYIGELTKEHYKAKLIEMRNSW